MTKEQGRLTDTKTVFNVKVKEAKGEKFIYKIGDMALTKLINRIDKELEK